MKSTLQEQGATSLILTVVSTRNLKSDMASDLKYNQNVVRFERRGILGRLGNVNNFKF